MNKKIILLLSLLMCVFLQDAFAQNQVISRPRNRNANRVQNPIIQQSGTVVGNGTQTPTVQNAGLNNNNGAIQNTTVNITDTILSVDTLDMDGLNGRKYKGSKPSNALKSENELKNNARLAEQATVAEAAAKKNAQKSKVLPTASGSITKKNPINTAVLSMPDLREDDATYNEFVWREIDAREKINRSFIYKGYNQQGRQMFFAVLWKILKEEKMFDKDGNPIMDINGKPAPAVTAYDEEGGDDFVQPLILDSLEAMFTPKVTTSIDVIGSQVVKSITAKAKIPLQSIYTFDLKEQYIFDKKYGQLFRRIIAIAPVALIPQQPVQITTANGAISYQTPTPIRKVLFWVNYDEVRPYLSKYKVYNPMNKATEMSWSDLLDLGYFEASIYKTTIDNDNDRAFRELFKKDNAKRLEYAEKIKQKIFDQEQDRWVY
jgi:gliding motility associated protien GldN